MSENNTPPMRAGLFGWNELITSDVEGAKKFYGELFGWTTETKNIAPGWDYHMFKNGETMVGGMFGITPEMGPMPSHVRQFGPYPPWAQEIRWRMPPVRKIMREKMVVPETGCFAIIQDPQGAVIALWKCEMSATCE